MKRNRTTMTMRVLGPMSQNCWEMAQKGNTASGYPYAAPPIVSIWISNLLGIAISEEAAYIVYMLRVCWNTFHWFWASLERPINRPYAVTDGRKSSKAPMSDAFRSESFVLSRPPCGRVRWQMQCRVRCFSGSLALSLRSLSSFSLQGAITWLRC